MSIYVTTNIRLLEEDYLRLKAEAAKKRTSLSAVIRDKVSGKKKTVLSKKEYITKLLTLKGGWISDTEYKRNRAQLRKRSQLYNW